MMTDTNLIVKEALEVRMDSAVHTLGVGVEQDCHPAFAGHQPQLGTAQMGFVRFLQRS
jgi:ribosomal protein L31